MQTEGELPVLVVNLPGVGPHEPLLIRLRVTGIGDDVTVGEEEEAIEAAGGAPVLHGHLAVCLKGELGVLGRLGTAVLGRHREHEVDVGVHPVGVQTAAVRFEVDRPTLGAAVHHHRLEVHLDGGDKGAQIEVQ